MQVLLKLVCSSMARILRCHQLGFNFFFVLVLHSRADGRWNSWIRLDWLDHCCRKFSCPWNWSLCMHSGFVLHSIGYSITNTAEEGKCLHST